MFKKILCLLISALFLGIAPLHASEHSPFTEIFVEGDKELNGIFDLSIEYGPDGIGWMAYSRVSIPKHVSTHLAKSTDQGASWHYVGVVNQSHAQTVHIGGKTFEGVWRYETPSLVYDPWDVPEKRWKLYSERYYVLPPFKKNNTLHGEGWIEYKTARSPEGPWSGPVCLFGQKKHNCKIQPNALHPSLSRNMYYNEIGTLAYNGVLYMSLDASPTASGLGEWEKRAVVLFSSLDHGNSWRYNGVLTDYRDASSFGYFALTGTSLVEHNSKPYLLVTPSGKKGLLVKNRGHDGCYLVGFHNINGAKLERDSDGKLHIIKNIPPEYNSGGLCDYHKENRNGGILFSQIDFNKNPVLFGVYNTGWTAEGYSR